MSDDQRIDELRRRIQKDPASIAFAALAEEHRRLGALDEAVRLCREGLEHHPTYLLGHVTLGRALLDMDDHTEARVHLEYVLSVAPDNLLALKCMTQLREPTGEPRAAASVQSAAPIQPAAPVPVAAPIQAAAPAEAAAPVDPSLAELEGWLDHIVKDRDKGAGTPT